MITLESILVPTDFSDHSEKALRYGVELATKFQATLHVIHALEPVPSTYIDGGFFPFEDSGEVAEALREKLHKLEVPAPAGMEVVRQVCVGSPFVEITRYAKAHDIHLVVIGTHGRGAIAHMLLGSVAERVVRKAPCPVLVVREEEHDFVMP